jgi:amino-acid N-acetyltransferase
MVMPAIVPSVNVPEINIRPALRADVPTLLELLHREGADFADLTPDEVIAALPTCYLAEAHGSLIGCAALLIYNAKIAEVTYLAVAPLPADVEWSVGRALINACVELARERRIFEVMLVSEAEAFMEACGFQEALKRQKRAYFYQDVPQRAMRPFMGQWVDKQPQDKL